MHKSYSKAKQIHRIHDMENEYGKQKINNKKKRQKNQEHNTKHEGIRDQFSNWWKQKLHQQTISINVNVYPFRAQNQKLVDSPSGLITDETKCPRNFDRIDSNLA